MSTPSHASAALGAVALFASAAAALLWANIDPHSYAAVFGAARPFVNDGLMAVFFFVVGMEIKRELTTGALTTPSRALLPAAAALGGMAVPALVFLAIEPGGRGWGIPMATDIAFAVGVLSLLDTRVPRALVVFITALAVFDDIGAIVVIALFYGHGVDGRWLGIAAAVVAMLWILKATIRLHGLLYAGLGALLWYALFRSGVHATLSGVALGLLIPARALRDPSPEPKRTEPVDEPQLERFVPLWRPWVTWLVLPLFALANAGVPVRGFSTAALSSPIALGVGLGLLVGKLVGIFGVTALAVKLRFAPMPEGTTMRQLFGASLVAGIGFTVALFIAALAYPASAELEEAKAGVLVGSTAAALLGAMVLRWGAISSPGRPG